MRAALLTLAVLVVTSCATPAPVSDLTLVITGGTVYSGDNEPPHVTDIWIMGDRIVGMGNLGPVEGVQHLDATGLAVTPGFIDIHSHAVRGSRERSGLLNHPDAENYIRQGVTTAIGGPDGGSWLPVSKILGELESAPASINFGTFVGHNTIRNEVMQRDNRAPTTEELARMQEIVRQAMTEGAYGLSTGLKYMPGAFSKTSEVIALASIAGEFGGIHISHMREEGLNLLKSVKETIEIGEKGGLPTQITHHKVVGKTMWGKSIETLAMVDEARARGVDVSIDQYPYAASSTGISILLPDWSQAGDWETQMNRLNDEDTNFRIRGKVAENLLIDRGGGHPSRVVLANCDFDPSLNGKSLANILDDRQIEVNIANAAELVVEIWARGGCMTVFHAMAEEDVERIMQHPQTMIGSDGGIHITGEGVPHPRNYGAFARVIDLYVRENSVLPLHTAIHKMTGMVADRLSINDRGRVKVGGIADLAIFDPGLVRETATFENPHQYAEGMTHVLVNGKSVLLNGEMTGSRPGQVLRHDGER